MLSPWDRVGHGQGWKTWSSKVVLCRAFGWRMAWTTFSPKGILTMEKGWHVASLWCKQDQKGDSPIWRPSYNSGLGNLYMTRFWHMGVMV